MNWKASLQATVSDPWAAGDIGEGEALVLTLRILRADNVGDVLEALPERIRDALLSWAVGRFARESEEIVGLPRGLSEEPPAAALDALRQLLNRRAFDHPPAHVHVPPRGDYAFVGRDEPIRPR